MGEIPKDYSQLYHEDNNLVTSTSLKKKLDGTSIAPRHIELGQANRQRGVDLRQVVAKLEGLSEDHHKAYAVDALTRHYKSVFANPAFFKVYIMYEGEKEAFVVRVERNTLQAVREKLPKKGNYRYFFKQKDNTNEEVEADEAPLPFFEKDSSKQIYCLVFPK